MAYGCTSPRVPMVEIAIFMLESLALMLKKKKIYFKAYLLCIKYNNLGFYIKFVESIYKKDIQIIFTLSLPVSNKGDYIF
jgi:hypothetical protein